MEILKIFFIPAGTGTYEEMADFKKHKKRAECAGRSKCGGRRKLKVKSKKSKLKVKSESFDGSTSLTTGFAQNEKLEGKKLKVKKPRGHKEKQEYRMQNTELRIKNQ